MPTTTANIGRFTPEGLPFFGRFGLAVQEKQRRSRERCLKKSNGTPARRHSNRDARPITQSIFRDAVQRSRLTEQ